MTRSYIKHGIRWDEKAMSWDYLVPLSTSRRFRIQNLSMLNKSAAPEDTDVHCWDVLSLQKGNNWPGSTLIMQP